jgi:hypothetical protein
MAQSNYVPAEFTAAEAEVIPASAYPNDGAAEENAATIELNASDVAFHPFDIIRQHRLSDPGANPYLSGSHGI